MHMHKVLFMNNTAEAERLVLFFIIKHYIFIVPLLKAELMFENRVSTSHYWKYH